MSQIKQLRIKNNQTQSFCAKLLGISLRSYIEYENNPLKEKSLKYSYILDKLTEYFKTTEEKGILTTKYITTTCAEIFKNYNIDFCYLFGSYAKGTATEQSDVDLLISINISGLKFFELVETLRNSLHKKIDLLNINQLNNNQHLLSEIFKTGIKIYG